MFRNLRKVHEEQGPHVGDRIAAGRGLPNSSGARRADPPPLVRGGSTVEVPGRSIIPERLKPTLRRWIVAAGVPPLAPIYRAAYRLLIHLAGLRLARFPGAKAVYLRRGWAKCETLPGVSDIDLAAVGDWDEEQCGRLRDRHRRLAWLLPVFDPRLRVYSPESLRRTYLSDPFLRHRIQEGTRTWKLLRGRDCLGDLPPLTRQQVLSGYHAEIRGWWLHFVRRAYPPAGGQRDEILRNNICYKAVAETLRAELALQKGALLDSRKQILERAPDMLPMEAASASFLERLARSASERHLRYQGDIVEDTQRFLLPRLESCFRYLVHQMRASPFPSGVPRLDAPAAEQFQPAPGETVLTELADCARERLRVRRRGCYVTSGLSFAMDEVQFLIETGRHDLPSVAEIHGLGEVLRRSRVRPRRRVCVYLLLPCCAYQILAPDWSMPGQAVLTPASCPEVFQMLATPEALVSGAGPRSGEPAAWTQAAEDALCLDRGAAQQVIESAAARATESPLVFLRAFWRSLQLEAVHRRVAAGDPVRPLTPPAVRRALESAGLEAPSLLDNLEQAYRAELRGEAASAAPLAVPALSYLRRVAGD